MSLYEFLDYIEQTNMAVIVTPFNVLYVRDGLMRWTIITAVARAKGSISTTRDASAAYLELSEEDKHRIGHAEDAPVDNMIRRRLAAQAERYAASRRMA